MTGAPEGTTTPATAPPAAPAPPADAASAATAPPPAEVAERIAEAVTALPDVAGLSSGHSVRLATYRAGPPVTGVAVREDAVEIGVVARYGRPLEGIADEVRATARPLSGGRRVDVLIADLAEDGADGQTNAYGADGAHQADGADGAAGSPAG